MFNKVTIRNFRNFHKIEVELTNKNIVIGMNDVGKSNFLHALRLIFDKKVRFEEICDTDFHQKNTSAPISIIITLDISDESKEDVQKILACVKEARIQEDSKLFYIKLEIESNLSNGYLKHYTWGDDLGNLKEIKTKGLGYLLLDDVFNVIYIPSHIETAKIFNDIRRNILQEIEYSTNDEKIKSEIFEGLKGVNDNIEKLSSVKNIAEQINKNLEIFDESYKVKITSQSVVDDLHKQLKIFTYEKDEDILFPASGDGRQKKIMYAMLHYFLQKETRKIPLLILEEPENHLYLTAQIDLSDTLFSSTDIKYIFMSSHSAQLLYYINSDCSLIRLYRSKKISGNNNTSSNSSKISEEYHQLKRIYVEDMSKGYFADCVLLVEGYSEKLLCDTILKKVLPQNFYQKIYVLPVLGTNFKPYRDLLLNLGIDVILRTDNDIYKNDIYGLKRCYKILGKNFTKVVPHEIKGIKSEGEVSLNIKKIKLNEIYRRIISFLKSKKIYLAEIDLENDLKNALDESGIVSCSFDGEEISNAELIVRLQDKKWHNMYIFLRDNSNKYKNIFNDKRFEFLKEVESCLN